MLILTSAFYWVAIRPSVIKKSCFKETLPTDYSDPNHNLWKWTQNKSFYDNIYSLCLKRHGI